MANRKISALTAILSGDISTANDYLPIVDASVVDADKNKRVTVAELGEAILAAGLTTDVSFTGNVTQTGTTAYAYKLARSGGGDKLRLRAEAAGGGGIINAVNSAEDDLEPLGLGGEHVVIEARVSAGATRQVLKVSDSGVTQYNSDGSRWHTWGHNTDGVHWTLSNNGDDFRWINSTGDIAMLLNATGTLVVGRAAASSNPLQLVANDATGDCYMSFYRDNVTTRKGYIGYGASASDNLQIYNEESNSSLDYSVNGSGAHNFYTGGGTAVQLQVAHTASAVNYLQLSGAAAGGSPYLIAAGSNANVGIDFGSRGTGGFTFYTRYNVAAKPQFQIGDAADTVNYLQVTGGAAGSYPDFVAAGSDANIGIDYGAKGSGSHVFYTNWGAAVPQFAISHTASAVNYLQVTGGAAGNGVNVSATGSDSNVDMWLFTKGSGRFSFHTNASGSNEQVRITHTAGAVNYLEMSGAVTGGTGPWIQASGSDTNIDLRLYSKGTGAIRLYTAAGTEQVRIAHTASAVNIVSMTGNTSSNPPVIRSSSGTDTNVGLIITSQGTGDLKFMSTGGSYEQVRIVHTANAVNYLHLTGGATGTAPAITAAGSDTNINLDLVPQGTGSVRATNSSATNEALVVRNSSGTTPYGMIVQFNAASPDNNSQYFMLCNDATATRAIIYSDGDLQNHDNSYGAISDERLKTGIRDSGSQWDDIKNMRVRKYKFISDGPDAVEHIGVVAQELQAVSPGLVTYDEKTDVYGVQYSVLYMKAIKALQEAMARIERLESALC